MVNKDQFRVDLTESQIKASFITISTKQMAKLSRKQLGKGLGALLSDMNLDEVDENNETLVKELANTITAVPIAHINRNPDQPRRNFDLEALEELAESIKVHGLIQPITVRRIDKDNYQIISGERRFKASKIAGLDEIPAYIRLANDQEMMEMALIENIQRQDLNPVEIATTYSRLKKEFKLTDETLAERVGKQRSTITNYLRVLNLPPDAYEALRDGEITLAHAKELLSLDKATDMAFRQALLKQIIEQSLSVRAVKKLIADYRDDSPKESKKTQLSHEYKAVQDELCSHFGKKIVLKVKDGGKGQIVLPFKSTDDLNDILEKMNLI